MMNNSFVDADYGPIVEDVEQIVCMYLLKKNCLLGQKDSTKVADRNDLEECIVRLAELCSLDMLPQDIKEVNKEELSQFYRQYTTVKGPRKYDKITIEVKQMDAVRSMPCLKNVNYTTLLRKLQLDLLRAVQFQLEKAFLSKFQITANARKFAGKSVGRRTSRSIC